MSEHDDDDAEIMELKHDALPGYKPVFNVVFVVGILYLALVFALD